MLKNIRTLTIAIASSSLLAAGAAAVPARASSTQESVFQDDRSLIFSGDARRQRTLDEMKSLGATTVHALLFWDSVAPNHNSPHKPAGFNAADPNAYPPGAWDQYDALVSETAARGMQLIFTPTRAPAWAGRCGRLRIRNHCDPNPREYQQFLEAVGRRYPTVHRWSFWNEPNQGRALQPQQVSRHRRLLPWASVMYRNLLRSGIAGLKAAGGHSRDQFLLGETAPLGQRTNSLPNRSLTPVAFFQGVFCLDSRGRPLRGRVARDMHCTGRYAKLPVNGVAIHPYTRAGSQPPTWIPGSGEITVSTLGRLSSVLAQGVRAHRIRGGLGYFFTEYGFQTNPPDRTLGVSLSTQARWLNQSDWMAYRNGRVKSVAQYELFDDNALAGFQTGLRFKNGVAKPGLDAYRLPIWVTRSGSAVRVWGQVRPAGGRSQRVQILNGNRRYRVVKTVRTNSRGFINLRIRRQPGPHWRLSWTSPDGHRYLSRVAGIGR